MAKYDLPDSRFRVDHFEIPIVMPTVMPITVTTFFSIPVVIPAVVPQMTAISVTKARVFGSSPTTEPTVRDVTPSSTAELPELPE